MNASPGLIHMVQEALNSPMSHAPAEEYGKWTIQELACWIMGFEHAMRMVESYINAAQPRGGYCGRKSDCMCEGKLPHDTCTFWVKG